MLLYTCCLSCGMLGGTRCGEASSLRPLYRCLASANAHRPYPSPDRLIIVGNQNVSHSFVDLLCHGVLGCSYSGCMQTRSSHITALLLSSTPCAPFYFFSPFRKRDARQPPPVLFPNPLSGFLYRSRDSPLQTVYPLCDAHYAMPTMRCPLCGTQKSSLCRSIQTL